MRKNLVQHDRVLKAYCGPSFLHAHNYQAAQQDCYTASTTSTTLNQNNPPARSPSERKDDHTTT
jgi:hypothetical protein